MPAGAAAKPGYYVIEPSRVLVANPPDSGGYSIAVVGVNTKSVGITVSDFTFQKTGASSSSATYSVRGRVTGERIEGRLGSRGRVSVRFEPTEPPEAEETSPGCKGKPSTWQNGRFTGAIRFEGENGFARAHVSAAEGFVIRSPRLVCKRPAGEADRRSFKNPSATSLSAVSSRYPRAPWFSVFEEKFGGAFIDEDAEYNAATTEKRRGMTIYRSVNVRTSPDTFAVAPLGSSPVTATVEPPAPFSGTATYEKRADGAISWSGDLAVELPGRGELPLADSSYRAKLCRSFACACPIGRCTYVSVSAGRRQVPTAAAPTPSPWHWPGSPR
ncbi:MAG: hypothetical protein M3Y75_08205 [Actinomycetota bacterium]|nr:hypothetical protein [Actinomycetota bacterium]